MGKDFDKAKVAFISGDPRKLADYVRTNKLTDDQAEFIAMALAGEVKVQDGRSERIATRDIYYAYREIRGGGYLLHELFGVGATPTKADIYRKLADLYGYSDEDTVKKAISRAGAKRSYFVPDEQGNLVRCDQKALDEQKKRVEWTDSQGRQYAFTIPKEEFKWMLENWCPDMSDCLDLIDQDVIVEIDPDTGKSRVVQWDEGEKVYAYDEINPETGEKRIVVETGSVKQYYDDPKITDEMLNEIRTTRDTIKK